MPTRVEELQAALRNELKTLEEGLDHPDVIKVEGKGTVVNASHYDHIMEAKGNAQKIQNLLMAEQFPAEMKAFLDNPATASVALANAASAAAGQGLFSTNAQYKSLGEAFTSSDEFEYLVKSGRSTMDTPWELDTFDVASKGWGKKDVWGAMNSHTINAGVGTVVQFDPTVSHGMRVNRVRDLFPAATTSANLIDYFKVLGLAENSGRGNAAPVRDRAAADGISAPVGNSTDTFGLKPKSTLQFVAAQAPVRTIAHWEAAHRNILQDQPQLQSTINNELLYGLALEEDDQILNGSGNNEDLLGILNTSGIQTYNAPNGELKSDSLRRAQTKGVLAYFPPTGYVVHPNDWEKIELQRGSGDGQYMLVTNIAVGMSAQVWRLPVVETPAINEGTFLTGAFGTGAQLYDRARASIRIAEQHADFFVRNAVAILVEERLALAVKRPESFVKGTFV